ncbi:hypothetical protein [Fortiea contorta]|nr:hypothetical protein [Fortiea contorta]
MTQNFKTGAAFIAGGSIIGAGIMRTSWFVPLQSLQTQKCDRSIWVI